MALRSHNDDSINKYGIAQSVPAVDPLLHDLWVPQSKVVGRSWSASFLIAEAQPYDPQPSHARHGVPLSSGLDHVHTYLRFTT